MCTNTERIESQVSDAEPTTAMNSASTTDKTADPTSRTFQPFGSGTDDNDYECKSKEVGTETARIISGRRVCGTESLSHTAHYPLWALCVRSHAQAASARF